MPESSESSTEIKIKDLYRYFVKIRSFKSTKAVAAVFIRYGKYAAHAVVVRLNDGRWSCSNDSFGRHDFFSYQIEGRGKLDVLRALVELKLVSKKEFASHKASIIDYDAKREREYEKRQMEKYAEKLGYKLTKKAR